MGTSTTQTSTQTPTNTGAQAGAGVGNSAQVSGTDLSTTSFEGSNLSGNFTVNKNDPVALQLAGAIAAGAAGIESQVLASNTQTSLQTVGLAKELFANSETLASQTTKSGTQQGSDFVLRLGLIAIGVIVVLAIAYTVVKVKK